MQNRIRELRKSLNLTQADFGAKITLSQRAIANLENGSPVTERNFNAICKTFGVNPEWLRNGVGEMFAEPRESRREEIIRSVVAEFGLDESETNLIRSFLELSPEHRQGVLKWAEKFAVTMSAELAIERQQQKPEREMTREDFHTQLDAELDVEALSKKTVAETSSASTGTNGASKKISTRY